MCKRLFSALAETRYDIGSAVKLINGKKEFIVEKDNIVSSISSILGNDIAIVEVAKKITLKLEYGCKHKALRILVSDKGNIVKFRLEFDKQIITSINK